MKAPNIVAQTGKLAKFTNFMKFKTLHEKTVKVLESDFHTSDIYDLNKIVSKFGISLKEKENVSVLPFTQIEGIKKDIEFTKVLPLFDKKKGDIVVIHIAPSAAFTYTIKNSKGAVVQTVKIIAGDPSSIVRIQGSENFFTLEGNTNV